MISISIFSAKELCIRDTLYLLQTENLHCTIYSKRIEIYNDNDNNNNNNNNDDNNNNNNNNNNNKK